VCEQPPYSLLARAVEADVLPACRRHGMGVISWGPSAIIGPRTMDQLESHLGAADVELPDDVLDRIDEIIAPGVNVNPGDAGYANPALTSSPLRR
jgi:aryl-alcohol dehydrogenase-like predicted oxidoreductase